MTFEQDFMENDVIRPQDNFFRYVNKEWLLENEIPSDKTSWGSFNELNEKIMEQLHELVETDTGIVGNFYTNAIGETHFMSKPLSSYLIEIMNIKSVDEWLKVSAVFFVIMV